MVDNDIFASVQELYDSLTKAEKKVADYVQNDKNAVLYMSITELAGACGVCDSTVFRFCRKLKLDGYQEFRMKLAQSIGMTQPPADDGVAASTISDTILQTAVQSLNDTSRLNEHCDIQRAAEMMVDAGRIIFLRFRRLRSQRDGRRFPLYAYFTEYFFQDSHFQAMASALTCPGDVVIAFSYYGATKDTINNVKIAKKNGSKIICITRYPKSPLAQYADIILRCAANEGPFEGGSLGAKISQIYILEVLYTYFYSLNPMKSKLNREKVTSSIVSKLL